MEFREHNTDQFNEPNAIAIDASGNIRVVDEYNQRVEEFNSSDTYVSKLGSSGPATASLMSPGASSSAAGDWANMPWPSPFKPRIPVCIEGGGNAAGPAECV